MKREKERENIKFLFQPINIKIGFTIGVSDSRPNRWLPVPVRGVQYAILLDFCVCFFFRLAENTHKNNRRTPNQNNNRPKNAGYFYVHEIS